MLFFSLSISTIEKCFVKQSLFRKKGGVVKALKNLGYFFYRKRLLLFDANWRWQIHVLSDSCLSQIWCGTCDLSLDR